MRLTTSPPTELRGQVFTLTLIFKISCAKIIDNMIKTMKRNSNIFILFRDLSDGARQDGIIYELVAEFPTEYK